MASVSTVCVIHFDEGGGRVARFTEHAYQRVLECREIWKTLDGKQREVAENTGSLDDWQDSAVGYHRGCYSKFTNKTLIDRAIARCEKARLASTDDLSLSDKETTETPGK